MGKSRILDKKRADIILVGGGSGGHLTPLVPVAEELHKIDPALRIAHIGKKKDKLNSVTRTLDITQHYEVSAGKLRRFHGDGIFKRLLRLEDNLLNVRDFFRVVCGIFQSLRLLGKLKPQAIFFKGGYVGVPVGIAARLRKIPYITHDSDAMISLANRIIGGGATYHATAQKIEYYNGYDEEKLVEVGLPIRSEFVKVTDAVKAAARKELGYSKADKIIFVTGGGQGAQRLNDLLIHSADKILKHNEHVKIIHLTGHKLYEEAKQGYEDVLVDVLAERVEIIDYSDKLHVLSAAADIVVTRAGASAMAEFERQAKACIIIPNPYLTGGHQTKNSKIYTDFDAAIVIEEEKADEQFSDAVISLIDSKKRQNELGAALEQLFTPHAAQKTATLLMEVASSSQRKE